MNRDCHRIIFNARRGQLMAVAETAQSAGKSATGESTGSTPSLPGGCRNVVVAMWLAIGALPMTWAQIIADPTAPANQRPTVLSDSQGRPLVNIQTPSAAGLSRNTYRQFDVPNGGIVLNNSAANPWLANGVLAKTILNEVNSSNQSYINGAITVNGASAQVIVANPVGITVNGGAFINASRATLTTGIAQVNNGALTDFNIRGGGVLIGTGGLNNSATPYTDIMSRIVSITGKVQAQNIGITTGLQSISYDTGLIGNQGSSASAVGTLSIDTTALGGMYANNISILATEAGLGVRNQGTWQAGGGQIVVTADGLLHNVGNIQAGIASLATVTGNIENTGLLQGGQAVVLSSGGDTRLFGVGLKQNAGSAVVISAKGSVNLYNDARYGAAQVSSMTNGGQVSISAGQNITLNTGTQVAANGDVQLSSDALISASNASITASTGRVVALAGAGLSLRNTTVTGEQVHLETGAVFKDTAATISVTGGTVRGRTQTTLLATDSIRVDSPGSLAVSSAGNVHIQAAKAVDITADSRITAGQHMSVMAGTSLTLQAGTGLSVQVTMGPTAQSTTTRIVTTGTKVALSAGGNMLLSGNSVTATGSTISAGQDLSIEANDGNANLYALSSAPGASVDKMQLTAGKDLNVSAFKGSVYASGLQASGQNINLMSSGTTSVAHATIQNGNNTQAVASTLTAREDITVGSLQITPGAFNQTQIIASNLNAGGQVRVDSSSGMALITAATNTINGVNSAARSTITAGSVVMQGATAYTDAADIRTNGDKSTKAKSGDISIAATSGMAQFSVHTGSLSQFNSTGNIALHANGDLNYWYAQLNSGGNISGTSATARINSTNTQLTAKDVLSLASKGAQTHTSSVYNGGAVSIFNETGNLVLNSTAVAALGTTTAGLSAVSGQANIESGGAISVDSVTRLNAATDLSITAGAGDITITPNRGSTTPSGLQFSQDQFKSGRDISILARNGILTLAGTTGTAGNPSSKFVTLNAKRDLNLTGSVVQLQAARLSATRDISIASHSGLILIDGLKNPFTAYIPKERVDALIQEKDKFNEKIESEINLVNSNPAYIKLQQEKELLLSQFGYIFGWAQGIFGNAGYVTYRLKAIDGEIEPITKTLNTLKGERDQLNKVIAALSAPAKGAEHLGALITGRNVNITSAAGLAVYGGEITASGSVKLSSAGVLPIDTSAASAELQKPVGTLLAGLSDFYEYGAPGSSYHAFSLISRPTVISGQAGVTIQAVGNNSDARLVINDSAVKAASGVVKLQSLGDMRLESGQEEFYSQTINTYTSKSWLGLKKKTTTEIKTSQAIQASPVVLEGKNIEIKSGGSIDAYATAFLAPAGSIQIIAANALSLRAIEEVNTSKFDAKTRSSFLGGVYSKEATTSSRTVSEQLPAKLVAQGANTVSGWNSLLQGTIFQTSLMGANIAVGVGENARTDAKVVLEGIKRTVTESKTQENNYVVWQRQLGSGSTVETLMLPTFTGPKAPVFSASGGISVQLPAGDFKNQVQTLTQQPGMAYLTELTNRKDVNWQPVKLAFDQWSYKQEGLTPAGAALLAVAVAWVMPAGVGANLMGTTGTTTTAMANAAFTSLSAQAAISFVNNKGDIGKTLKDLGSSQTVKATIAAALTAGVLDKLKVTETMTELSKKTGFSEKLTFNLINSTGRALTNVAINGGDLESALKEALIGGLVDTAHGQVASEIKSLESEYVLHKLAHALAGCVAGAAAGGTCKDGAIGGAVGEIVAELMPPANKMFYTEEEKRNVLALSKLVGGATSAYAGGSAQTAITTAETAVQNNAFFVPPLIYLLTAAASAYTTGVGDGNPIDGLKIIGQGNDPLSKAMTNGTQAAVSLSMSQFPKETTATLNLLAAAGQKVDATLNYLDATTGKIVSVNWNSLSQDTRNMLIGAGKVTGVVLSPIGVGEIKNLVTSAPKAITEQTRTLAVQGMIREAGQIDPLTGKPKLDLNELAKQPRGYTNLKEATGDLFGNATIQTLFKDAKYLGGSGGPGINGLDAVFKVESNNIDYLFVEYKYNTSRQGMTANGLQGSMNWIAGSNRIENAVGRELAPSVRLSASGGRTETLLIQTLPDGRTNVKLLDVNGRSIPISQSRLDVVQRITNNLNKGIAP